MSSMDRDEVTACLEEMAAKAARKGQTKKRFALICALECRKYMERISRYGDCNTCHKVNLCEMRPPWGGQVRINCPQYLGPNEVEPWRKEGSR